MERPELAGKVQVHRYRDRAACDVVVTLRGREMVLTLPNYRQAVKWAQIEAKSYGITAEFPQEHAG